ncbi:hypothetical protein J1N35_023203 [Gossypium stocksii]|uniref:Uncharacterized protein n=1 Tax=Gossypium stocksii TaxID=47602 RepID=A0A9D3VJM5_9ROSI|nr:hypothetical protein J1N35_023203 [Gossypium stocksii]
MSFEFMVNEYLTKTLTIVKDGVMGRSIKKVRRRSVEPPNLDLDYPVVDEKSTKFDGEEVTSWKDNFVGNQSGVVKP